MQGAEEEVERLRPGRDAEGPVGVLEVGADRVPADAESGREVDETRAAQDEGQDLALAGREGGREGPDGPRDEGSLAPRELLEWAVREWDAARVPRCRSIRVGAPA
jgi:hypothetical protein